MTHAGYSRNFESTLRELARRGYHVHVAFDRDSHIPSDEGILERLAAEYDSITVGRTPLRRLAKKDPQVRGGVALRSALDYLGYFREDFRYASKLRTRASAKAPAVVRRLVPPTAQPSARSAALAWAIEHVRRRIPPHHKIVEFLQEQTPDVLLVTPLIEIGSPQFEYVSAARQLGIPVVHCVASWDNLTTKGRIHDVPDLVTVWNEAQRAEAVRLHEVPSERVVATGAAAYDHWFTWRPSTSRAEFCAKVGLADDRPFILYLGSSEFIAPDEHRHVAEWLRRLREAPETADLAVLIRPHPTNPLIPQGQGRDLSLQLRDDPLTTMWPPQGANPTTADARADYFDSLHHAVAAVGVNTSGLIESAIVGCPVFTLVTDDFRDTQQGTLHFHHLSDAISGTAASYEEHLCQIAAAVRGETDMGPVLAFVERFVRPYGLDAPATPRFVAAIEDVLTVGTSEPSSLRPRAWAGRVAKLVGRGEVRSRRSRSSSRRRRQGPLKILFGLHYPGYLRYYDSTLAELSRRGHTVFLCFDSFSKQAEGLDALEHLGENIVVLEAPLQPRRNAERRVVRRLRRIANYAHYLDPAFRDARPLRARARSRLPTFAGPLGRVDTLPRPLVGSIRRLLRALERALPLDPRAVKLIQKVRPDVVVVSPLVVGVSPQADLLHAAGASGIPRALAVASWDHLTTKGAIRVVPERVFLWNDAQRAEAVELHGIPSDRIVVTGAQPFDKWFDRRPGRDRDEFCRLVGLDPARPFVLFVGSTASISTPERERRFVVEWIRALRASSREETADCGILVRPHPYNRELWAETDLSSVDDRAVVWPRQEVNPVSETDRADYFDSLYHADAVVGVNTSAMIEASIVGRPVLTISAPEFADTQGGTLHFRYLLPENGGFASESRTLDEHIEQLASVLHDRSAVDANLRRFVERFVRPHGLERSATQALADAIEATAALTSHPLRSSRIVGAAWLALFRREGERLSRKRTATHSESENQGSVSVRID